MKVIYLEGVPTTNLRLQGFVGGFWVKDSLDKTKVKVLIVWSIPD